MSEMAAPAGACCRRGRAPRRGVMGGAVLLAALIGPALPSGLAAQYERVPEPSAYALEGVTVVRADGSRRDGVTLVVRDAWIEAIGRDVAVPPGARVLEGAGLMVYPGLVDADGRAAYELPAREVDRSAVEIWNAPRELKGFTPSLRLVSYLTADGASLADQRREGIVAAAVHPPGPLMAGRGVAVLHRPEAEVPGDLVLDAELGPRFSFRGGQGVYPATLFGVTAFIRQSFEDARHQAALARAYAADPRGLPTPRHDADHEVLRRVLAGEAPVFFEARSAVDILRVLGLAEEYGFRPVIVGGDEAWQVADELRRRSVPVLIDVDFPEPRRWKPEADSATEAGSTPDAAELRERREFEDRYANAGRLAAAGVTFALTSGGSGKLLEGAREAVANGLDPDDALTAMTSTPATLIGFPALAALQPGHPATFIVARGPLLERETEIAFTFVEGRLEEGGRRREAGDPDEAADFSGEWLLTVTTDETTFEASLVIEQEGATFTGTMRMPDGELEVRDGVIDGNEVSMVAIMRQGGETLEVEITGTVEGERASGQADAGPLGVARWTARRTGPGGAR